MKSILSKIRRMVLHPLVVVIFLLCMASWYFFFFKKDQAPNISIPNELSTLLSVQKISTMIYGRLSPWQYVDDELLFYPTGPGGTLQITKYYIESNLVEVFQLPLIVHNVDVFQSGESDVVILETMKQEQKIIIAYDLQAEEILFQVTGHAPVIYPDNLKILYVFGDQWHLADIQNNSIRAIADVYMPNLNALSWDVFNQIYEPYSNKLAYVLYAKDSIGNSTDLVLILDLDTGNFVEVLQDTVIANISWAADGKYLLVAKGFPIYSVEIFDVEKKCVIERKNFQNLLHIYFSPNGEKTILDYLGGYYFVDTGELFSLDGNGLCLGAN